MLTEADTQYTDRQKAHTEFAANVTLRLTLSKSTRFLPAAWEATTARLQQLGGVGGAVDAHAHGQPRLVLEPRRQPAHRDALADDVDVRAALLLRAVQECEVGHVASRPLGYDVLPVMMLLQMILMLGQPLCRLQYINVQ